MVANLVPAAAAVLAFTVFSRRRSRSIEPVLIGVLLAVDVSIGVVAAIDVEGARLSAGGGTRSSSVRPARAGCDAASRPQRDAYPNTCQATETPIVVFFVR